MKRNYACLMSICCLVSYMSAVSDSLGTENDVSVGVVRWDNWFSGSSAAQPLRTKIWNHRLPYFAKLGSDNIILNGSNRSVLRADTIYAKSAGIDYFLFGYYSLSDSWGRDHRKALNLDSALRSYMELSSPRLVKFAIMLNYSFPSSDATFIGNEISQYIADPDYIENEKGSKPLFIFTPELKAWVSGIGGEQYSLEALSRIRKIVLEKTGSNLYFVAMPFDPDKKLLQDSGFDALSAYASPLGNDDMQYRYETCLNIALNRWKYAESLSIPFLPTVTTGWDPRPLRAYPRSGRDPKSSWCKGSTDSEWNESISLAINESRSLKNKNQWRSILLYAWNEFAEGGWIAPTWGEGNRRISLLSRALGRQWQTKSVIISHSLQGGFDRWPCPANMTEKGKKVLGAMEEKICVSK